MTTTNPKRERLVHLEIPLALLESGLSLVLGFITLGSKSLWRDEAYSATVASGSWQSLYRSWRLSDANMSLYDILLHIWRTLGTSDAMLRTLSVLAAAASVLVVFAIGRRLFGGAVGLLAGLFMAIAPFAVHHSQQVRSYSLTVLLVSLASYFLVLGIERPRWAPWTAYTVVASLAVYAHFFAALVLVAHAISLLFLRERPWRYLWVTAGAILLLLAPGVYVAATGRPNQLSWLARPDLRTVFGQPARVAGGVALALVFVALLIVAVRFTRAQWREAGASFASWRLALLFAWLAVPAAVALLYSWLIAAVYLDRFLIVSLPALVLIAAVGVAHIPSRWALAATVAVVVLSLVSIVGWYRKASAEGWRDATAFTTSSSQRGDGVMFCGVRRPFEYYVLQDPTAVARLTPVYPPDPWQAGFHRDQFPPLSANEHWPDRVWIVDDYGSKDPPRVARAACGLNASLRGYELTRSRTFEYVRVQLYERGA